MPPGPPPFSRRPDRAGRVTSRPTGASFYTRSGRLRRAAISRCFLSRASPVRATFVASPFEEDQGTFSPDGRRVAYVSDESGRQEVFVASFPDSVAAAPDLLRGRDATTVEPGRP